MSIVTAMTSSVRIGDREFSYQKPWDGRALANRGYVAFDTETEVLQAGDHRIPRLALATASAGDSASAVIHPGQVGPVHPGPSPVPASSATTRRSISGSSIGIWRRAGSMRPGRPGGTPAKGTGCTTRCCWTSSSSWPAGMRIPSAQPRRRRQAYAGLEISKDDPYPDAVRRDHRRDWAEVEDGFFDYAIKDAIVTLRAFRPMLLDGPASDDRAGRAGFGHRRDVAGTVRGCSRSSSRSRARRAGPDRAIRDAPGPGPDPGRREGAQDGPRGRRGGLQATCPELFKTRKDSGLTARPRRLQHHERDTLDLRRMPCRPQPA